jgi:hypothetical protein
MNKKDIDALTSKISSLTSNFNLLANSLGNLNISRLANTVTTLNNLPILQNPQNPPVSQTSPQAQAFQNKLNSLAPPITFSKDVTDGLQNILDNFGVKIKADTILNTVAGLTTAIVGYSVGMKILSSVFDDIRKHIFESFKELADVQAKALATNIVTDQILKDSNVEARNLRSAYLDVQKELLNFREAGILKFNANTINLADRMIFTGQKVGTLATFLTNTALAIGINTQQASELAKSMHDSSILYGVQAQTLFEVADSMKSVNSSLVALLGPSVGPALLKAQNEYINKFGTLYSDQIKTLTTFLADPTKQTAIISAGLTREADRFLKGMMSAEELKLFTRALANYFDRSLGRDGGYLDIPGRASVLEGIGGDTGILMASRAIANAEIRKAAEKDIYESTIMLKDIMTSLKNNITLFAEKVGISIREAFGGKSVQDFRNSINPIFESLNKFTSDFLIKGVDAVQSYRDAQRILQGNKFRGLTAPTPDSIKFEKETKEEMQRYENLKEKLKQNFKTSKLDSVRIRQLQELSPVDSDRSLQVNNAQLAALERIEKNTYDQKRMTDMSTRLSTMAMNLANNQVV